MESGDKIVMEALETLAAITTNAINNNNNNNAAAAAATTSASKKANVNSNNNSNSSNSSGAAGAKTNNTTTNNAAAAAAAANTNTAANNATNNAAAAAAKDKDKDKDKGYASIISAAVAAVKRKRGETEGTADASIQAPPEKTAKHMWLLESQDGNNDPDWVPIQFEPHSILNGRYVIMDVLGKGTFGVVLKCVDIKGKGTDHPMAAVKVSAGNSKKEYMHLKLAYQKKTPRGATESCIVEPLNTFDLCATSRPQQKYVATVMALADSDLASFMATTHGTFALRDICLFGKQLLTALTSVHGCGLVHADVKPQNCLIFTVDGKKQYKLADFGSSFRATSPLDPEYMVTRQYRPPEVVLRLEVGTPVDIWSAACVIAEFALGSPLFVSSDSVELVTKWCEVLGPPPAEVVATCPISDRFFCWQQELATWIHPPLGHLWSRHRSRKKRQDYFYSRHAKPGETGATAQFARPMIDASDLPMIRVELAHNSPGWGVRLSQNVAPGAPLYTNANLGTAQWHPPRFRELRTLFEARYPGIGKSQQGLYLIDALEKMLKWNPAERLSAKEALRHAAFSAGL